MHPRKISIAIVWGLLEHGGMALLSFVSLVIYTRILLPDDFGLFSIALAITDLFGLIVTMMFHDYLIQKKDITENYYNTAFTFSCVAGVFLFIVNTAASGVLAESFSSQESRAEFIIMGLLFPISAIGSSLVPRMKREFRFKQLAMRSLGGRIVGALIGIILAVKGFGVWSLIIQNIATVTIGVFCLYVMSESKPKFHIDTKILGEMMRFSRSAFGGLFILFSTKRIFTIIAGWALGLERAGNLNLVFRYVDVFWSMAVTAISQVGLPVLSRIKENRDSAILTFRQLSKLSATILNPCFIGLGVVSKDLLEVIYGAHFAFIWPYAMVLSFLVLLQTSKIFISSLLSAFEMPKVFMKINVYDFIVLLTLSSCYCFFDVNIWGFLIVWIIRELINFIIGYYFLITTVNAKASDILNDIKASVVASFIMAAVLHALNNYLIYDFNVRQRICIDILLGALTYFLIIISLDRVGIIACLEILGFRRK